MSASVRVPERQARQGNQGNQKPSLMLIQKFHPCQYFQSLQNQAKRVNGRAKVNEAEARLAPLSLLIEVEGKKEESGRAIVRKCVSCKRAVL